MPGFDKIGEREIYRGHVISMAVGTFVAPDGTEFDRDLVHHPGAVSVVPLLDGCGLRRSSCANTARRSTVTCSRSQRASVTSPAKSLLVTAQRELAEEVGLLADRYELLAEFYNSPGFSDEHSYTFLARGLRETPMQRDGIEEESMEIEEVPLASRAVADRAPVRSSTPRRSSG